MTESVFNTAYGIWNSLISLAMTLFTTSPTAANASVYSTCRLMYNAITDISLPVAIVFFLIAICKDVVSSPPDQQVRKFFSDGLKFCILIGILANLWDVMGYIMQIADGVTDKLASNGSATYLMSMSGDLSSVIADVENLAPETEIHFTSFGTDLIAFAKEYLEIAMTKLLFFIASIITLAIIVASCISILSSAFQRILKPLAILPFSSITVALASGSHEAERVTVSYIKTFFGFCISGAFMVICVKLGTVWFSSSEDADIPTLYPGDKLLFVSSTKVPYQGIEWERFSDYGYTIGVANMIGDTSGHYRIGWGGLPEWFDSNKSNYSTLKNSLTEEEYKAARSTVTDSFYTPRIVMDAIYQALDRFGFKGGNILEPAMGIGNFYSAMPEEMKKNSNLYGVEIDSISGRIAQLLHPNCNIQISGIENASLPQNYFDCVIGNVPFGEYKVNDRKFNKEKFMIHDYFFAKALDLCAPGGVICFVTSKGTLDKKDGSVRRYISERADFLGAIRLPNTTFSESANTEVTSDIIFLKKKAVPTIDQQEFETVEMSQDGIPLNS